MRIFAIVLASLFIASCGKKSSTSATDTSSGGGGGTPTAPKAIINEWQDGAFALDLSGGNLTGTSFQAINAIAGQICIMTLQLGPTTNGTGTCEVISESYDNLDSTSPDGSGSFSCAQNAGNTCGAAVGVMGSYNWNGVNLTFPSNGINYH